MPRTIIGTYLVTLYSKDEDYSIFGYPDMYANRTLRYDNGAVDFRTCVGVEYDTMFYDSQADRHIMFASDEPWYFLRTEGVLRLVRNV